MKKSFLIVMTCLFSYGSYAENNKFNTSISEVVTVQQYSNWEFLGSITASVYSALFGWSSSKFDLYVKVISGKAFYQVREGKNVYSVSVGDFSCQGKKFNASFKKDNDTYYFNI